MLEAGVNLRVLREELGLTMRDVETATACIAERHDNDEFAVSPSRLSDIETKGLIPSIFRLYSLAVVYNRDLRDLLSWYGIDLNTAVADVNLNLPPKSHRCDVLQSASVVQIPTRLDPGFDARRTSNLGRMVEQWGLVPLTYLASFATPMATSAVKISRCIPCFRPALFSRWMSPRTRSRIGCGAPNTSVQSTSWKRGKGIPAAGAP